MMNSTKDWYLVKYVYEDNFEYDGTILTTWVHRDNIESLLAILKHEETGTNLWLGDTYYTVIDIYFKPAKDRESYNVIYVEVDGVCE